MDQQEIPALVMGHCLCEGCKKTLNKLKKDIPEIHSIEFDTEHYKVTIFGAVDPAKVMEKLKKKAITPKILSEESSPIYQEKQIVLPKASVPKIHNHVEVVPHETAVVHFGDFPSEIAGTRIQDEPVAKKTPDCYLNNLHELKLVEGSSKPFYCNRCKEKGFNPRYRCENCDFDLHQECTSPELTTSPEFYKKKLLFEFCPKKPPKERMCDACGNEIHGCFYNCKVKDKSMDLHPCCAKLKARVRNNDMVLVLCEEVSSKCLRCRKNVPPGTEKGIPGWCYVSECNNYNIHIHCITQMLHEAWQRGLMDHTGESSIVTIDFQLMTVSARRRGRKGMEALKIISIFRMIIGVVLGDPSVFFASLMAELLKQLL